MNAQVVALRSHAAFMSCAPAAQALTVSDVVDEVQHDMSLALSKQVNFVPGIAVGSTQRPFVALDHRTHAIFELLRNDPDAQASLMTVLDNSACPRVQALRDVISRRYGEVMGPLIAEIRGIRS